MRRSWAVARAFLSAVAATVLITTAIYCLRQPPAPRDPSVVARESAASQGSIKSSSVTEKQTQQAANTAAAALPSAGLATNRRPRLTVVCVSDTHGLYAEKGLIKVPEGNMLLFPGDVEVGSAAEGLAFALWLEGLEINGPRVITWGNMDTATPGLTDPVPGAMVIVNSIQEVNGYRIFGSPWTLRFAGAYQLDLDLDDTASFKYWSKLLPPNSDVDIIMTHGPPYGISDFTGGRHRGDKGLLRAVQALEKPPLLWVCGHIHEQYGEHRVPHPRAPSGNILLINSAVYYVQQPEHAVNAQPRAVRLPEAALVPRG